MQHLKYQWRKTFVWAYDDLPILMKILKLFDLLDQEATYILSGQCKGNLFESSTFDKMRVKGGQNTIRYLNMISIICLHQTSVYGNFELKTSCLLFCSFLTLITFLIFHTEIEISRISKSDEIPQILMPRNSRIL